MHEQVYADPLNDHITDSSFAEERAALYSRVESYRTHPFYLRILWSLVLLVPVVIGVFFLTTSIVTFGWIIVFYILGLALYGAYIAEFQREAISMLLCEQYYWMFNPNENHTRARRFAELFPDIFERGSPKHRKVDNEIWGSFGTTKPFSFWSGIFYYTSTTKYNEHGERIEGYAPQYPKLPIPYLSGLVGFANDLLTDGSHRNEESTTNHFSKQVFIFELQDMLHSSFILTKHGSKRDMETESVAFNKKFHIRLHNHSKEAKRHVIQTLSPSVQVRLTDLAEKFPIDMIAFQHNCMVVLFDTIVWEAKHTNFFKSATIDERDVRLFDHLMREMTELPVEIRKFVD